MIRKVRFPLRYKFVVAISTLLLLTMAFYLSYALNIFKADKAADVYSITLSNSISLSERLRLLIDQDIKSLETLDVDSSHWPTWLERTPQALVIECLTVDGSHQYLANEKKLSEATSSSEGFTVEKSSVERLRSLPMGSLQVEQGFIKGFPAHYSVLATLGNGLKCALHLSTEKLMPLMNETLNYGSYIVADNGSMFLKLNDVNVSSQQLKKIVTDATVSTIPQGVKRFVEDKNIIIRAFSKANPFGLTAITEIEEEKAFLASTQLIQKSLFFGILLLSVAVITGILFTRRMTRNVQTLFEATSQMAEGNFNVNPQASGHDEIGALTDSFVDMKDKIVAYMIEMKEKARIESELKVAQLVQHSFFPRHGIIKKDYSVEGMYKPASECSGDWWGFFEQPGKVTLVVCDATGHGVPAALITAAAHSCLSTLKLDAETKTIHPHDVLEKLNKVVCSMNSDLLMTAFVLEIDENERRVTYANASHMAPYYLKKGQEGYSKEGLTPLIENNGPRMGEKYGSQYSENSFEYRPGDRIVLFSDGLTEMEVEGKAWGQRNFLKSLYQSAHHSSKGLIQGVWQDFQNFCKGHSPQDDVTLLAISFNNEIPVLTSESNLDAIIDEKPEFVLSQLSNAENINFLSRSQLNHLIGHNTIDLNRELKLVQILESKQVFNLEDTVNDRYKKKIWHLHENSEVRPAIAEMVTLFNEDYSPAISGEILSLVSEELLSNAFYHSSSEESHARGQSVSLIQGKEVEYLVGANEDYVIISVRGPSSFSSREKIIESIHRGYEQKAPVDGNGGAGLGLYLIFENCQQFWVINSTGAEGQIICVFEKFNRYKKAKERITSFHFLSKEII